MIFSSYGNFHIKTFDDVVVVTLYGSSDNKIVDNLAEDLINISRQFLNKNWAVILNVIHWDYVPPQIMNQKIKEVYQREDHKLPEFLFFLVADKNQEKNIRNQYMFQNLSEVHYIKTIQEAVDVLNDNEYKGFKNEAS